MSSSESEYAKSPPFFSVVMPAYNKGAHISRAISSVLNQEFCDFEVIVIDDASTDNSLTVAKEFTDPRLRVFQRDEPGPGGYAARNLGIQVAKAEWVAFLDADDQWYPEHLGAIRTAIESFPNARVFSSGYTFEDPGGEERARRNNSYYQRYAHLGSHALSFSDYLRTELVGGRPIWTSAACISRPLLLSVGGFPAGKATRGGDVDTWWRCIAEADGMVWSAHIGAVYYRNSVNMVTRTEPSLASVERQTVACLIPRYGRRERRLLRQLANRRTVSAWRQNTREPNIENFFLPSRLYWSVNLGTNLFWSILSLIPRKLFNSLERNALAAKQRLKVRRGGESPSATSH